MASNGVVQTAGWFAQKDERHWPRALQRGAPGKAKDSRAKDAPKPPHGSSLEDLRITMTNNLYAAGPGQKLFQWGPAFGAGSRHTFYDSLDAVRRELALETGSEVADPAFAGGCMDLDFRLTPASPASARRCYPRGDVPGVKLSGSKRD